MKKLFMVLPLVFLLCFTFSCQQGEEVAEEPVIDVEAEKQKVQTWLDLWISVIETEDIEMFSKIFAHDSDMVNIGTDADEWFLGYESLKESFLKQWESFEAVEITTREVVIKVHNTGEVAWFSGLMDGKGKAMGEPFGLEGLRFTGILEKRNGNWVMVHWHISVPMAGQAVKF